MNRQLTDRAAAILQQRMEETTYLQNAFRELQRMNASQAAYIRHLESQLDGFKRDRKARTTQPAG